jgi:DNA-damage-inducible protein D
MAEEITESFPFEEFAKQNGIRYWFAHDLMSRLGYESYSSFVKVINKAISSCAQLGIQIPDAFISTTQIVEGREVNSYKLTRFACFLVALHADGKKPQVASAKIYFAAIAESIIQHKIASDDLERLEIREEIKSGENQLSGIAKTAGIDIYKYGLFRDAGYRGMYDMGLRDLKRCKGVDAEAILYDYMGKTELAANWFRITQTSERIKSKPIQGQVPLENAAFQVGREVRNMMIKNSGVAPESLPVTEHIGEVRKRLTKTNREMIKLDKPKTKKK